MKLRQLGMILTLDCKGAAKLLSDAEDRRLGLAERLALIGHLLACIWCRRYRKQLRILTTAAAQRRAFSPEASPTVGALLSEEAKVRMRARLLDEMRKRGQ